MKHSLFWVVFCSLVVASEASAAETQQKRPAKTELKPAPAMDSWSEPYATAIRAERRTHNTRSNIERIVGGSLAFALGTYGYYNDSTRQTAGKIIYSATQSGGILALSSGIVGLSSESPLLALDSEFLKKGQLSYDDYKRIVVRSRSASELAEIQKTAIASGLLATLYAYNGYMERNRNLVLRNTFGFLAFNFTLFSSVSFYRWINYEDSLSTPNAAKITASIDSLNSVSIKMVF